MPAVSIIIRTKNEGSTLPAVFSALQNQTRSDYEVILVDSGSTDNSLEIARACHARIIEIPPSSFSYGYALNIGFAAAQGEYGISLAGHAVPANSYWLQELLKPFAAPQVAGATSRQLQHWWHRSWALSWFSLLYRCLGLHSQAIISHLFVNSCSAIRLSVWRELPFDESLPSCEDQLWARQALRLGYRLAYCPDSLVIHWHRQSLASKYQSVRRDWLAMRTVSRLLR